MTEPDWQQSWRELTERARRPEEDAPERRARHAARFDSAVKRKSRERPDTLLDFVLSKLKPEYTVLDIGAGTGHFAVPFARIVRSVTAVEPSSDMADRLRNNASAEGLANIRLLGANWEEAEVDPHDVAFCSHAMYASPDFAAFVRKMEASARESCFLAMRMPAHDGLMRELSNRIYGSPYDSPNFWVGFHALYDLGIYPDVVMEPMVRGWADDSIDEALGRARRHLSLADGRHDDMIREALVRRLRLQDGRYHWPDGMRSALLWWRTSSRI